MKELPQILKKMFFVALASHIPKIGPKHEVYNSIWESQKLACYWPHFVWTGSVTFGLLLSCKTMIWENTNFWFQLKYISSIELARTESEICNGLYGEICEYGHSFTDIGSVRPVL